MPTRLSQSVLAVHDKNAAMRALETALVAMKNILRNNASQVAYYYQWFCESSLSNDDVSSDGDDVQLFTLSVADESFNVSTLPRASTKR